MHGVHPPQLPQAQLPKALAVASAMLGSSAQAAQKAAQLLALLPAPSVAQGSEVAAPPPLALAGTGAAQQVLKMAKIFH